VQSYKLVVLIRMLTRPLAAGSERQTKVEENSSVCINRLSAVWPENIKSSVIKMDLGSHRSSWPMTKCLGTGRGRESRDQVKACASLCEPSSVYRQLSGRSSFSFRPSKLFSFLIILTILFKSIMKRRSFFVFPGPFTKCDIYYFIHSFLFIIN
jgi:hypothetical protein